MFSDKLLTLLGSFSKYELNRFRKFLQSPYFNEQEYVLQLFDLCNNAVRQGGAVLDMLDKYAIWKQIFPHDKLDDAHLRRLSSDLTQLALKFLALEYREQNPVGEWLDLQRKLESPNLQKHLASVVRQLERHFEEPINATSNFYLNQYLFHWNIFNRATKTTATSDYIDKLLTADFHIESYFLIQKLKLYVAWLSIENFRTVNQKIDIIPGFWEFLSSKRFYEIPIIKIYRQVVLCLTDPEDEQHFKVLMDQLNSTGLHLDKEDLRECYQIAQNYCALKINQGKTHFYHPVFEIYRTMIQKEMLLLDGQLSEAVYKNVITSGLLAGEYAWSEQFIQQYADFLPLRLKENARSYNLAYLNFHQGKHDRVIELLRSVEYSDITYAVGAKLMLLRTYYETGEMMALDSLIESVRIYLRRNRLISKVMSKEFGHFLNFLKKLSTISTANRVEIAQFRQKVVDNPAVISKKWLLEKIDEME